MNTDWTLFDFLVNGEFADANYIRCLVGQIRRAAGAACAVLLVYQGDEIFTSLLYVSLEDEAREGGVQDALTKNKWLNRHNHGVKKLLECSGGDIAPAAYGSLQYTVLAPAFELFPEAPVRLLVPRLQPRTVLPPFPLLGVLCLGGVAEAPETADRVDALAFAVNASAPVYLRRLQGRQRLQQRCLNEAELLLEKHFDQAITEHSLTTGITNEAELPLGKQFDPSGLLVSGLPPPPPGDRALPLSPLHQFLCSMLSAVGATQGGVFMLHDEPLELRATRVIRKPDGWEAIAGENIDLSQKRGVVWQVFDSRRPYLFNERQDFEQMTPRTGFLPMSPDSANEVNGGLAVPVVAWKYKGGEASLLGVINAEKCYSQAENYYADRGGARPFTLGDYWFLHEAAQCLANVWTQASDYVLLEAVFEVGRKLCAHPLSLLGRGKAAATAPQPELPGDFASVPQPELPSDFATARADVQALLERVCHSVSSVVFCTVRVLSVDQRNLVLLAAYPTKSGHHLDPVIPLFDDNRQRPTLQTRAVRSGRRVEEPPDPAIHLSDLQSLVSIPIFVDMRCVGAATFASKFAGGFSLHNFPSHAYALRAYTGAIADALAFAQAKALTSVLGPSARVFEVIHELSKIPNRAEGKLLALAEAVLALRAEPSAGLGGGPAERLAAALQPICTDLEHLRDFVPQDLPAVPEEQLAETILRLRHDTERLRSCLHSYGEARNPPARGVHAPQDRSVRGLVERVLAAREAGHLFRFAKGPLPPFGAPPDADADWIDPIAFEVCLDAMSDLIVNAKPHITKHLSQGTVHLSTRFLGGRRYACVTINNPIDEADQLPSRMRPDLFRTPLEKSWVDRRLRYGAFVSAWLVRAIGGDVHLTGPTDDPFSVTVEIPLEMPNG